MKPTYTDKDGFTYLAYWDQYLKPVVVRVNSDFLEFLAYVSKMNRQKFAKISNDIYEKYGTEVHELAGILHETNMNEGTSVLHYLQEKALDTFYVSPGDSLNGSWFWINSLHPAGGYTTITIGMSKNKALKSLKQHKTASTCPNVTMPSNNAVEVVT